MPPLSRPSQFETAPMLLLAAAFAAGIGSASALFLGLYLSLFACAMSGIAALLLSNRRIATYAVCLAFFFAGVFAFEAQRASVPPDRVRSIYDNGTAASGGPVTISGTILRNSEIAPDGFFVLVDVDAITFSGSSRTASGIVRLFAINRSSDMAADYELLQLRPGDRVRIACELERDDGFRDPGVLSRRTVLDWQEIDATGVIKSPLLIERLGSSGLNLPAPIFDARAELISKFLELFNPHTAGVMIASLLGNKHFLDAETAQVFREGGTFHILVISGLHVTFIGGLAALFVGLFTRRRSVQFVLVCTFLWSYTLAVGAEVPVVRASLMFTVLWSSFLFHRAGSLANALGICSILLLAWRPQDLFTPSFQLTFVSVSAIVLAGFPLVTTLREIGEWTPTAKQPFPADVPRSLARFCEMLYWNPKAWQLESKRNVWKAGLYKLPYLTIGRPLQKTFAYVVEGLIVSLIVQAAMLPLTVHYFHRVTPVSIILNIWAGFLITLESFTSLFAVGFSYVSESLALPLVHATHALHWMLVAVPETFLEAGQFSFRVPIYSNIGPGLYAIYLAAAAVLSLAMFAWDPFRLKGRQRRFAPIIYLAAAFLVTVGSILVLHPFSEPRPDGRLHVEFIDVGQGDSTLITFPNGETMLVDGGGRAAYDDGDEAFQPDVPSIGETVVSEFLWERGLSRIGHLVGTHADADHIQGLADVARNFQIGQAWFGRPGPNDPDQLRLEQELGRNQIPINSLSAGDSFTTGGALVEVLHPQPSDPTRSKENDRSLVMRITYGERSFLLTGDIELAAESEIVNSGYLLLSDVVKVPHHGSKTSSTQPFVNASRPVFAVIPVGRKSIFGHPHREVVDRWRAAGAEVMTTGQSGLISFSTNGSDLVFESFVRNGE